MTHFLMNNTVYDPPFNDPQHLWPTLLMTMFMTHKIYDPQCLWPTLVQSIDYQKKWRFWVTNGVGHKKCG